ncbi:unnamed protein product, partial [Prorocentrum cordatum]
MASSSQVCLAPLDPCTTASLDVLHSSGDMCCQRYVVLTADVNVWVCTNAANELMVRRAVSDAGEGVIPHPVLAALRGEILSFIDANTITKEALYDTVVYLASLSECLRDGIGDLVASLDDLDVQNIADCQYWADDGYT